jgi:RHS repeat-associated protein
VYTYDGLNNLLTSTDPLGEKTQYTYDQNSNQTSVTDPKNTSNPTQFVYNNMNLVWTRTDALGNSDSYQYDLNGNSTCHTDRKGQVTVLGFDGLNRKISSGYGAASCTSTTFQNSTSYAYDGANRLQTAVDSLSGTVTRNYDGLDDLNYENTPQGTINYNFDSARRRTNMTVTGQTEVQYGYDAANHLLQILQGSSAVNLSYDIVGRRSSLTLPNGVVVAYSYDYDSHVTGITYNNSATVLGNLLYGYDALGRRSQATGSYASSTVPTSVSSALYNVANQITSWAGTSIAYDLDANIQNDGTNIYTWDLRNHLSAISGGSASSFQYDGLNRRMSKTINGTSTAFVYDGGNVVQELSGTTPTANLITGLTRDEIFSRTDASGATYFLKDALGNTVALTGSGAGVQTQYAYDPYGNTTTSGTNSTNAYQYPGRENDGTGLYFYRARYYQPGFERFSSEDPIDFRGGVNLFEYTRDNPINLTDPCGLQPPPPPCYVACIRLTYSGYFFCHDNGFGQISVCSCPAGNGFFNLPGCGNALFICYVPCSSFYGGSA